MSYELVIKQYGKIVGTIKAGTSKACDTEKINCDTALKNSNLAIASSFTIEKRRKGLIEP